MYRYALTGDGSNAVTADVNGKPGWSWIRYLGEQAKASIVINRVMPGCAQNILVVVGKKFPMDSQLQILDINFEPYASNTSATRLRRYSEQRHAGAYQAEFFSLDSIGAGGDPVVIDFGIVQDVISFLYVVVEIGTGGRSSGAQTCNRGAAVRIYDDGVRTLDLNIEGGNGEVTLQPLGGGVFTARLWILWI